MWQQPHVAATMLSRFAHITYTYMFLINFAGPQMDSSRNIMPAFWQR